jgi:hypothetical protein
MCRRIALSCTFLFCMSFQEYAHAAPVYLSVPFNVDIVREPGGTTTASLGYEGEALVTQTEAAANDTTDPRGLPDNGILNLPGATIQLGPYGGNNALRVRPQEGYTFGLFPPAQYTDLHLFVVAGDSTVTGRIFPPPADIHKSTEPVPFQLLLRFQNHPSGFSGGTATNYLEEADSYLIDGMDTTGANGIGFLDLDDAAIFHLRIPLDGAVLPAMAGMQIFNPEQDIPIGSSGRFSHFYVLGGYLELPEPASLGLLVLPVLVLGRRR